ncbi:MAG: peptidase protein [Candidatus Midichloriaceae bacterium]|jgi:prepilin signal peptidase PulO-like enzyme (type II secretory pathway)|nr:peptidase protein [Candidatus Midichloriaceae bacterium]
MTHLLILLISALYGVLLGNYLTTAYHRIPLTKPINGIFKNKGIKPHCSVCEHELKYWEYFPVFSWIFSKQRCNYCGVKVDKIYTVLEVSMMLISISLFAFMGMNLQYVFLTLFMSTVVLLIALYAVYRRFYFKSVCFVVISAALYIVGAYDFT